LGASAKTASPDPRAWVKISDLIKDNNLPVALRQKMYAAKIGPTSAFQFAAFERTYGELPDVNAVYLNPATAQLPTGPAAMYAISAALARLSTPANFGRAIQYLGRLPEEFSVFAVKLATKLNPTLAHTPAFTKWSAQYAHLTMA
jgi:hypothetical protein